MLAFRASGGLPSEPATFSDLRDLIALTISVLLRRLVLMSRSLLGGGMTDGAGRLSVFLKYSAHRVLCCSAPRMMFPSLSFKANLGCSFAGECSGDLIQALHVPLACSTQLLQSVPRCTLFYIVSHFVSLVGLSSSAVLEFVFLCLVLRAVDLVFQVPPLSDECPGVC